MSKQLYYKKIELLKVKGFEGNYLSQDLFEEAPENIFILIWPRYKGARRVELFVCSNPANSREVPDFLKKKWPAAHRYAMGLASTKQEFLEKQEFVTKLEIELTKEEEESLQEGDFEPQTDHTDSVKGRRLNFGHSRCRLLTTPFGRRAKKAEQ